MARARVTHQLGGLAAGLGRAGQAVVEAAALEQLQGHERQAVGLADVVDLDDVRMVQPRDRLGLDAEASELLGAGVTAAADHLQGHQPVQAAVAGLVDHPHAALAELLEDLVTGDRRPALPARLASGRRDLLGTRRDAGGPLGVVFGVATAGRSLGSPGGDGRRGEDRGPGRIPPRPAAGGSRGHLRTRTRGDPAVRRRSIRGRPRVAPHRIEDSRFAQDRATRGQALELILAGRAKLDVRQQPILGGVEIAVEISAQFARAAAVTHGYSPSTDRPAQSWRCAIDAHPGIPAPWSEPYTFAPHIFFILISEEGGPLDRRFGARARTRPGARPEVSEEFEVAAASGAGTWIPGRHRRVTRAPVHPGTSGTPLFGGFLPQDHRRIAQGAHSGGGTRAKKN